MRLDWKYARLVAVLLAGAPLAAARADTLRAGKAVETSFPMSIMDLGVAEGIFAKYGVELEISAFTGDAKLQQAFAARSIDVGFGSGPSMAFELKGSPVITVAAFAGEPRTISVAVIPDSPIKTASDLKGKLMAISNTGSLTEWLVRRLAVKEGWGPDGVRMVALGAGAAMNGALFTKEVDAMMTGTENALIVVDRGQARLVTSMESFAPDFLTHVVFASTDLVQRNPDLVDRFLKGFFASIAYAKANKAKAIQFFAPFLDEKPSVFADIYDHETPMLIDDGHLDPKAVAVLKDSFIDMGILAERPPDDRLFTTRFVPVRF